MTTPPTTGPDSNQTTSIVDSDPREQVLDMMEQLSEALDGLYDSGAETGYQDGLNDALVALRDYRSSLDDDLSDLGEAYLDGLNDAIATLIEAGAQDADEAPDGNQPAPARPETTADDDDVAEA